MDFIVPTGIRLDLAEVKLCLPDEIGIQLNGNRSLYNNNARSVLLGEGGRIKPGESTELSVKLRARATGEKLWVTRGEKWVPTLIHGPGATRYLHITNIGDRTINLSRSTDVRMWLPADRVPHQVGYGMEGSQRYGEWQNLAYQATTAVHSIPETPLTQDRW
ncbi:hypothetical protein PI125_g22966 [Phytophthora idaei]|nr:hypothetical protein PI125_g22966 [Phytophthora idaei]